jgi:AcrR family transcriptional regulator
MAERATSKQRQADADEGLVRERILGAAFQAFTENGYAGTTTLEIATRAQVSKRDLYILFGNKQEMLAACINARAKRLQLPADIPEPRDRETLSRTLVSIGTQLLREISDPAVIAVFRLAVAEAVRAPEVARALDSIGGEATRAALKEMMTKARSAGLLDGDPGKMAVQFAGLLWGNLMVGLLLGVAHRPNHREIGRRARDAATAFLQIYPLPDKTEPGGLRNEGERRA